MLNLLSHCVPVVLYAETHFRFFRFFPNLLFRKFPEVIFNLPRRVEPGVDLPVLLLLNDVNRFRAECLRVNIAVSQKTKPSRVFSFETPEKNSFAHTLSHQSAAYVFRIPRAELDRGTVWVNCTATVKQGPKISTIVNDNLVGSTKFPFSCFLADEPLPGKGLSCVGDVHVHSQFSQSHVEFGPPIAVIAEFSKCYGNDFVAVTDHSYDVACSLSDYLKPDPALSRWESIRSEVTRNTLKNTILLGEEISCLNSSGNVVHLLALGIQSFIPGSLDGARKNAKREKQLSVQEAITQIHHQKGVAFAAHPGSTMGFMQRAFLKKRQLEPKRLCR